MLNLASKARPYFGAVVLTCGLLTAGGIYSATRMPSGVYPEVTFPRIAVVARVPDWDVTKMEVKVTRPLEEAVSTVLGVTQVRSKSIRGGSELSIEFAPGTDMRQAVTLAWNRIGARRADLPPNVDLTVEQMTPSIFPIVSVVLTGGDNPAQLRDYAYYQLAPLIKTIPDVLYANVAGGDVREIEVIARPDDLLAAGLSAADLADQIGQQSSLQPVGRVEGQPFAFHLLVNNQPQTIRQIEEMVISNRKDQPLRVRDVADVKVLHQDRALSIGFDQRDAVVITVFRRLGGNTVNVSRDLRALLDRSQLTKPAGAAGKKPPRNIQATVVYDQADFVQTAVANVRDAILIGGLFSVLILLAFLRSWRATLISALAIPTTLAITLLFLHWAGETLNLMSLGGLAVAIGLIIDDTVVVVENIARHLVSGGVVSGGVVSGNGQTADHSPLTTHHSPPDPIDAASGEITGAVVGSTLTTVLVFLPLAFIVGVYGQFFAALSWSLSIAVLVSMVISLTLIPVFAAKFLAGRPMPPPGPVYQFLAWLYEHGLSVALYFPRLTLTLSVAAVAVGFVLFTGIPNPGAKQEPGKPPPAPLVKGLETGLMPAMDEGSFILDYWAPSGSPLAETERMVREVEKILSKNPDIDAYVRRTGAENGIFATQTSRGDIQVALRPAETDPVGLVTKKIRPALEDLEKELQKDGKKFDDPKVREEVRRKYRRRPMAGWTDRSGKKQPGIMDEVEDEVKDNFAEHQLKIELVQIMADELNDLSGASKPIEVKLFGPDQKELRRLATDIGEMLEKKGKGRGIQGANSNVFAGNPDLMVDIDPAKAERLGLKPDTVSRQLRAMFLGQIAAQVQESSTRITDVRVRYPDAERFGRGRFDPQRILRQWVLLPPTTAGASAPPTAAAARAVPLSAVAAVKAVRTPDQQFRENQQPAAFVTAEIKEDEAGLGTVVKEVRSWMADVQLPAGYRWDLGGHFLKQREAFQSLLLVMVVAVLLVFIMLAFQFQSVALPLLIFLTQPLSLVSGLFALWLTDTPLNVSSYMGAILLVGLDMKNGILLVEYIQQLRREGMELRPALLLAGRTRFRPILMTSLAAILGLFPLALGIGPGAQMQQPLAIMVIGGLTANMLFTRMVIPVGYLVMEGR
ncbi:MAG TPA: efflux RND transporter permease subunit, partial [Gemmataceae bacterium]|nr:efflux RND transporter permease subunit [Gemmataceae bacterium]